MPYALEKSIFASRTFWLNFITTAVAMLTLLAGQEWIAEYPKVTAAIGVALGLLNIALRWVTVDTVKFLALIFAMSLASAAVGSPAQAAVVDVVSTANYKLPLAPHKPAVVQPKSASACGLNGCGPVSRGGLLRKLLGR
jgi:hypothetical protein